MAQEAGPKGWFNPGSAAVILLGLAVFLGLMAFVVDWFSVDTRVEVFQYDPSQPDNRGADTGISALIEMDMRLTSLETKIAPPPLREAVERFDAYPSYEKNASQTGSEMLSIMAMHGVAVVALGAGTGFYAWQRKSNKDFSRTIWRFAAVFGAFGVFTAGYMAFTVPSAAEEDVHQILKEQSLAIQQAAGGIQISEDLITVEISFWPWDEHSKQADFPSNLGGCGGRCLAVLTTKEGPGGGFWLELLSLGSAAAGLFMARRAGHFEVKQPPTIVGEAAPPGKPA